MSESQRDLLLAIAIPNGQWDPSVLEWDIAGCSLKDHLIGSLRRLRSVRVAAMPHLPAPAPTAEDVLTVESNVWLSPTSLERLLAIAPSDQPIGVTTGNDLLAIYFPFSVVRNSVFEGPGLPRPELTVDARELDGMSPAVRVTDSLDFVELERTILYDRARAALNTGVRLRDPRAIAIRGTLQCGKHVEIDLNVIIEGEVSLGDYVRVGPHSILKNTVIGARSNIQAYSIVEGAVIGCDAVVGPYGRVRPGSRIGDSVQVGNFVEVKNSQLGPGSRVNHLSFIGDAVVGRDVTLGAGTITCNHDGAGFATTQIEDEAYVGSGTQLVAPVTVGKGATVGAGSTITEDAPAEKLSIARARQVTVPDWVRGRRKATEG